MGNLEDDDLLDVGESCAGGCEAWVELLHHHWGCLASLWHVEIGTYLSKPEELWWNFVSGAEFATPAWGHEQATML